MAREEISQVFPCFLSSRSTLFFIRFLEAHDEIVAKEKEKKEGANLLAPPDHDYVVLEAKELTK